MPDNGICARFHCTVLESSIVAFRKGSLSTGCSQRVAGVENIGRDGAPLAKYVGPGKSITVMTECLIPSANGAACGKDGV
jgi:hypothetical protein